MDDGFLHPPTTLTREFVDVHDFLRIPGDGLPEIIQFARVRVGDLSVIVVEPNGAQFRSLLEDHFRGRQPDARQAFLFSASTGLVVVLGVDLTEIEAFAVPITRFRCAWWESAQIRVGDDRHAFLVTVFCQNDKYLVSAQIGPT